jgi:general secretion pathway protein F
VREGVGLARALSAQKHFPPMLIHMIRAGEITGELPAMLERAANSQQEQDLERRALTIAGLLEPALILAMGVVVLLIVLAVLMPIIEINQLVR